MTMSILFYGVETWLLLGIMCGTKRLNVFQIIRGQWGTFVQPGLSLIAFYG